MEAEDLQKEATAETAETGIGDPETPATAETEAEKPAEGITALSRLATEKDVRRSNMTLRSILGGDILTGDWLRRQWGVIVVTAILTLIYIGNRYQSQQELIEIDRLKKELQDIKYDALTRSSELLERSRRSRIEEYLKATNDSTIQTATTPPYKLLIPKKR